jgi:hypothetical protein
MRIAVLVAMTAIALSSTPLVRLAFYPKQQIGAAPTFHAGAHRADPPHSDVSSRGTMSGLDTRSSR